MAPTDSSAAGSSTAPLPDAGEPAAEQPTEESSALPLSEIAVEGADDEEAEEMARHLEAAALKHRQEVGGHPSMADMAHWAQDAVHEAQHSLRGFNFSAARASPRSSTAPR